MEKEKIRHWEWVCTPTSALFSFDKEPLSITDDPFAGGDNFPLLLQSDFQRNTSQPAALRRKKKKSKRLDTTTTSGIFVRRGVSSPRTVHSLDRH